MRNKRPEAKRKVDRCGVTRKIRFRSDQAARARGGEIMERDPEAKPFKTYKCELCGGWHLTSK